MEQPIYEEFFRKSGVDKDKLMYVMDQIREVHTAEAGWEVGEPVIESVNADGSLNICVALKKYEVEKSQERSSVR